MSSSAAARVRDPLEAQEATFLEPGVSVATVPRSERLAPDVTAMHGAEAVAIVRARGFIAAIESVASELALLAIGAATLLCLAALLETYAVPQA